MNESTLNGALRATIERAPLAAALALLVRGVTRRNTIPILSNVAISADATGNGMLRFLVTNLDQQILIDVPAYVDAPGALTCDAAALADIVRKCPAGARVELMHHVDSGKVSIVAGRARSAIGVMPRDDFPAVADVAPVWSFQYDRDALALDLARLAPWQSTEPTRYYMNGIAWRGRGGALALMATDGTAGAVIERDGFADADGLGAPSDSDYRDIPELCGVIVPRVAIDLLQRAIKAAGAGDAPVIAAFDAATVRFSLKAGFGDVAITSKLIDGTFPDLQGRGFEEVEAGAPVAVASDDWRLNPRIIAKLAKSLGGKVAVALGDAGCIVTSPGAPEYRACIAPFRPHDVGDDGARPMRDAKGNIVEGAMVLPDLDEPLPYVEIPTRPVYMGAFLPDGWTLPVAVAVKKAKRDDAAALAAYCAGKVEAARVPVWTGARPRVWNADELQYVPDGYGFIWRDDGAMIADYAEAEAAPVAVEPHSGPVSVESDEPAQSATEAGIDAEALSWAEMAALPAVAPDATPFIVPDALKTSQFDKPAADVAPDLAALVASLVARIEALESERAPAADDVAAPVAVDNAAVLAAEARADDLAAQLAAMTVDRDHYAAMSEDRGRLLAIAKGQRDQAIEARDAMTRDRDDWQAIAEQNSARLDSEREAVKADLAAMAGYEKRADSLYRKRQRTAAAIRKVRGRADLDKRALAATVESVAQWRDDLDNARVALAAVTARAERAESELRRRTVLDPLAGLRYAGGNAALTR